MSLPQTETQTPELDAVADAIRSHDRFLVTTHENPDGDALGSVLAMRLALEQLGKDGFLYLSGIIPLPREYAFMNLGGLSRELPEDAAERVVLALDCANERRLGPDPPSSRTRPLVVDIDHHHDNSRFGHVNLIVPDASSTGEILYDLFRELGVTITPDIAEALYIALVTDTGRFQYTNTTPKALRIAAELVEAGANVHQVFQDVYENVAFAKLKLLARALEKARVYEGGRLIVADLERADFAAAGAEEPFAEGSSTTCARSRAPRSSRSSASRPPQNGPTRRVSLRTRGEGIDVSAIARKSGGGGHPQAAGFSSEARRTRSSTSSAASSSRRRPARPNGDAAADLDCVAVTERATAGPRPGRQAGRAVVLRGRRRPAPALRRQGRSRRDARSARDRAPARPARPWHAARALPRRTGQALPDRDPPRPPHLDRRRRGGGRRGDADRRRAGDPRARGRGRAARARGLGGQDRRRARLPAPPARGRRRDARRRSTIHALRVVRYAPPLVELDLHVSSGTYVRAIADALGGHCRWLRRTAVGPFRVEDADEERVLPPLAALVHLPERRSTRTRRASSARARRPGGEEGPVALWMSTASWSRSARPTAGRSGPRPSSGDAPPGARVPQLLARPVDLAPRRPGHVHRAAAGRRARPRRGAAEMGLLGAAALLPHLLFSLPAGVWLDRVAGRRRVMIAADLGAGGARRDDPARVRARRPHARPALRGRVPRPARSRCSSTSPIRRSSSRSRRASATSRELARPRQPLLLVRGRALRSAGCSCRHSARRSRCSPTPSRSSSRRSSSAGSAPRSPRSSTRASAACATASPSGLRFIGGNPIFRPTLARWRR